ncbi:MAG: hypothetical protein ACRC63_03335, partial [Metamycoplasmataceae bacterium]
MIEIHIVNNSQVSTFRSDLYNKGKSMRARNVFAIILWFTIVGAIVSAIISFIDALGILFSDFRNPELNREKLLWGLLALSPLSNIACLVFANKLISVARHGSAYS